MIKNQAKFTFQDLYVVFGPSALKNVSQELEVVGISSDSRQISIEEGFVALEGENFDGHDFIEEVIKKGCRAVFCSKKWHLENADKIGDFPTIIAKSGLDALHKLAEHHRSRFDLKVVAIGGSNGKTTTKELTSEILSKKYKVLSTYKNFNNQVGVPFMLLSLNDSCEVAVLEIGTNSYGEIGILTKLVRPTHGLITNIGEEHLEQLIDIDGVELEETALFAWCRQNNSYSLINVEDERLVRYVKALEKRMTYGYHIESNLRVKADFDENYMAECKFIFQEKKISAKLNMPGKAGVENASAAALIGFMLDVPEGKIKESLEAFSPSENDNEYGRMKVIKERNLIIFNDTYNSNPASVRNSFDILKNTKANRKVAFLGDMKELGEDSLQYHKEIIKQAEEIFDLCVFMGDDFSENKANLGAKSILISTHTEGQAILEKENEPETLILVKGSRSMKMEVILK